MSAKDKRRKLNNEQIAVIRWRWDNRDTRAKIAAEYGVSVATISSVVASERTSAIPGAVAPARRGRPPSAVARYTAEFAALSAQLERPPTQAELARHMDVTRERVRQIANQTGLPFTTGQKGRRNAGLEQVRLVLDAVEEIQKGGSPVRLDDVAAKTGLARATCSRVMKRIGVRLERRRASPERARWYERAKAADPEAIRRRNVEAGRRYRERQRALRAQQAAE